MLGGAICAQYNSHLTVHQCVFKENTATYVGGATYIQESQSLFESCIFERNKANGLNQNTSGGAIKATGAGTNITIKQCLFKENAATDSGGAIDIKRSQSLLLKNSTFVRNTVKNLTGYATGGAINLFIKSDLIVQQCLFIENTATFTCGAIFMQETQGSFEKCTFDRNSATSHLQKRNFGGAICALDNSHLTMHQCIFKENTATYSGGAIFMQKTRGSFEKCTFDRNSATSYLQERNFGGAICALDNSHLTMHQCLFKENTATYVGGATYIQESQSLFESCIFERNKANGLNQNASGGAIKATCAGTNITIKQCLFKENAATDSGGAIDIKRSQSLLLKNSTFVRNTVKNLTGYATGGAINLFIKSDLIVQQCLFKENTATFTCGAIFMQETRGSFEKCTFDRNSATSHLQKRNFGGAICALDNSHLTMHQCIFKENTATYSGGAIFMQKTRGSFEKCTFDRNSATSHLQKRSFGGAICALDNSHLTMHKCIFKENTATYYAGAIFMQKTRGSFENCTFDRNSVKCNLQKHGFGGAICALGNSHLTMHQCLFKENTATYIGGATHIHESHSLFESCSFEKNKAKSLKLDTLGGAICASNAGNIIITQCLFKENTATYSGGATFIQKSQSLFENCIFHGNKVISRQQNTSGGAISTAGIDTNLTIKQCLFKENAATYCGGAIKMQKARGSFVNCTFERNSVKSRLQKGDFGGSVCALDNSHITMHQCLFKENTATYMGGATYIQKSQSLFESCIFERNKVNSLQQQASGGVIGATDAGTNITIKQCLFKENTATSCGGAFFMQDTRGSFEKCTFDRNSAKCLLQKRDSGRALCALGNSHLTMHQCIIKENTATYSGGAIVMQDTQGSFENCTFVGNAVQRLQGTTFGGAISTEGSFYLMTQCLFMKNTATFYGGACYIQDSHGSFEKCTFEGKV